MEAVRTSRQAVPARPEALRGEIESFLATCRRPAIVEAGVEPLLVTKETCALTVRGGHLVIEAWDGERTFARRVSGVGERRGGRLKVAVERFGQGRGWLTVVDLEDARTGPALRRSRQETLAARFALMLARQYPGWRVEGLTAGADLEHTLSPAYPRALLRRGERRVAALCAPEGGGDQALTFGLLWLDYVRRREAPWGVAGPALFVARGEEQATALRLGHLNPETVEAALFVYGEEGEEAVGLDDVGNVCARLEPWQPAGLGAEAATGWAREAALEPGVEVVEMGGGVVSLRVAGLEFARADRQRVWVGIERKRRAGSREEVVGLARELMAKRVERSGGADHEWARKRPEARIEALVRARPEALDASLAAGPVYGQVCAVAGRERGLVDLLALDERGRLAVIEVKASEDVHLPMQALDYWMRVRHHAVAGEFRRAGYFPGRAVRAEAPRLLLVAPALAFHPTTETLLGFYSSDIEVERIGLSVEWQRSLRVVLRLAGASRPGWRQAPGQRA